MVGGRAPAAPIHFPSPSILSSLNRLLKPSSLAFALPCQRNMAAARQDAQDTISQLPLSRDSRLGCPGLSSPASASSIPYAQQPHPQPFFAFPPHPRNHPTQTTNSPLHHNPTMRVSVTLVALVAAISMSLSSAFMPPTPRMQTRQVCTL